MKVFVYRNLTRNTWSVKALEGPQKGLVIQHADTVLLSGAVAKVSQAGRRRVLRDKQKNVHAGVVGYLAHASDKELSIPEGSRRVTYNPYKGPTFVYADDRNKTWKESSWALLQDGQVHVLG